MKVFVDSAVVQLFETSQLRKSNIFFVQYGDGTAPSYVNLENI